MKQITNAKYLGNNFILTHYCLFLDFMLHHKGGSLEDDYANVMKISLTILK